jgi:hypothetical protein
MSPAIGSLITILKLDYNRFGSEGMKQLSKGFSFVFQRFRDQYEFYAHYIIAPVL